MRYAFQSTLCRYVTLPLLCVGMLLMPIPATAMNEPSNEPQLILARYAQGLVFLALTVATGFVFKALWNDNATQTTEEEQPTDPAGEEPSFIGREAERIRERETRELKAENVAKAPKAQKRSKTMPKKQQAAVKRLALDALEQAALAAQQDADEPASSRQTDRELKTVARTSGAIGQAQSSDDAKSDIESATHRVNALRRKAERGRSSSSARSNLVAARNELANLIEANKKILKAHDRKAATTGKSTIGAVDSWLEEHP